MVDVVSPATRSRMMSAIRSKNTKPELLIRKALHARGFRFRLHVPGLPGKPDLVFPKYRAVVFVNGCFWHGHHCSLFKWPATKVDFWKKKIGRNRSHDLAVIEQLAALGWKVLLVWECALKGKRRRTLDEVVDVCSKWLKENHYNIEIREIHEQ
jgi:DNA mismatch endonuclease (patch repair protein)